MGQNGGMQLKHLNLVTHEIDATQEFYETQFGFRLLFEELGERFLGNDDGFLLAISSVDSPADPPAWLHFGFCVGSAEEVERRYEQMTADGVEIAEEFFAIPGKFAAFYARDPGGHKVEVSWNNLG